MRLLQFLLLVHMAGVICANNNQGQASGRDRIQTIDVRFNVDDQYPTPYNHENNNQRISENRGQQYNHRSSNGNYEQRNYQEQERENNKEDQINSNTQNGRRRDQHTGINHNERRETENSRIKNSDDDTNENDESLGGIRKGLKEELLKLREKEKEKKGSKMYKNNGDNTKEDDEESLDDIRKTLKDELLEVREKGQQKLSIKENADNKYKRSRSSTDDTVENTESPDDIGKRLKDDLKRLRDIDEHKQEKFITISFLKMCTCDSDNATKVLRHFLAKAEESQNSSNGKIKPDEAPLVPDFKGNNSAKVEFYRHLTPDQNYSLFENDLIRSMCKAAKMVLMESKIPIDKMFPTNNSVDVNKNNET